ncbi:MAG: hypothetical protein R3D59_09235 [Paracoccaceae bacterium]
MPEQMLVESHSVAMLTYNKAQTRQPASESRWSRPCFHDTSAPIGMSKLRDAPDDPALAEFERS